MVNQGRRRSFRCSGIPCGGTSAGVGPTAGDAGVGSSARIAPKEASTRTRASLGNERLSRTGPGVGVTGDMLGTLLVGYSSSSISPSAAYANPLDTMSATASLAQV